MYIVYTAICTQECQNGGTCIAPDVCQCTEFLGGAVCTLRKFDINLCMHIRTAYCIYNYNITCCV